MGNYIRLTYIHFSSNNAHQKSLTRQSNGTTKQKITKREGIHKCSTYLQKLSFFMYSIAHNTLDFTGNVGQFQHRRTSKIQLMYNAKFPILRDALVSIVELNCLKYVHSCFMIPVTPFGQNVQWLEHLECTSCNKINRGTASGGTS